MEANLEGQKPPILAALGFFVDLSALPFCTPTLNATLTLSCSTLLYPFAAPDLPARPRNPQSSHKHAFGSRK